MNEKDLQVFVDGTVHYFSQLSAEPPVVDAPYLLEDKSEVLDYTGAIGVSGAEKGYVFFTASRNMLTDLLHNLGEPQARRAEYRDLVCEVANTISGNARRAFGSNFVISVPFVLDDGSEPEIPRESKSFVIPIVWSSHKAFLIIALQS